MSVLGFPQVYIIGGDGSQKGAAAIFEVGITSSDQYIGLVFSLMLVSAGN